MNRNGRRAAARSLVGKQNPTDQSRLRRYSMRRRSAARGVSRSQQPSRLQTHVTQLPYPGSIRRISAISDRRFSWCSRLNSSQPVIHSGSPMPCRARRRKASRSAPHDCPSVAIRNSWSDRPRTSSLGHSLTIRRKTAAFNESSREPRTSRTCGANRGPIVTRNSQAGFDTGHDSSRIHFNKSRRIGCTARYPCAVMVSIAATSSLLTGRSFRSSLRRRRSRWSIRTALPCLPN